MSNPMSTESHTLKCKHNRSRYYDKRAKFITTWKNYCRTCGGMGGEYHMFDPSAAGVGLGAGHMTEFEYCPDCIEAGKCPRCGKKVTLRDIDEYAACVHCNWDEQESEMDTLGDYCLPDIPECYCYERDNDVDIVEEELETRTELEIDIANDPERRARRDEADDALMFLIGSNDREDEGDDY